MVVPRSADAAAAAIGVCAEFGAPVLSRGGGTSLAGQCCNTAVVIDWTKYCHRVISVDPGGRTAIVQPGAALDKVNDAVRKYGLMVGPKPSTHVSCTIGGMIGNNSCGSTAQAYGKMADSVRRLEILTYDGLRTWTGLTSDVDYEQILAAGGRKADIYRRLRAIRDNYLGLIRTRYPDIPRRVSGYNLDYLLPEKQFHVAKALVGSESTLVTVLAAEIDLVEIPKFRSLVVLGYPDIAAGRRPGPAGQRPPPARLRRPGRRADLAGARGAPGRARAGQAAGRLRMADGDVRRGHRGRGQGPGAGADRRAQADGDHPKPHVAYLEDPEVEDNLWKVRELGLGATAYPPGKHETHEGWEDAAVPPERLGDYLRDFRTLLARHDYHGSSLYGHFGHGCVHTRIPFELRTAAGIAAYRSFVEEAADLVVSYGGSLSGEHGDGQSRGELLPKMFGPELIRAFGEMKDVFDPDDRMNPGKVVRPYRLDENLTSARLVPARAADVLRLPARRRQIRPGGLPLRRRRQVPRRRGRGDVPELPGHPGGRALHPGPGPAADGDGPGRCDQRRLALDRGPRRAGPVPGLQGLPQGVPGGRGHGHLQGGVPRAPLRGPGEARGALLDGLAPAAGPAGHGGARPAGGERASPVLRALRRWSNGPGGIDPQRDAATLRRADGSPAWYARRTRPGAFRATRSVMLWPDTFTNNFHPEVAQAAVTVLEDAGFQVEVPRRSRCAAG